MQDRLDSRKCARFLKALADPERLLIIQCLQAGPKNVSQLADLIGNVLANTSHHLQVLRHAGLVQDQRQGKHIVYSLSPEILRTKSKRDDAGGLDLGCCRLEWNGE